MWYKGSFSSVSQDSFSQIHFNLNPIVPKEKLDRPEQADKITCKIVLGFYRERPLVIALNFT